MPDSDDDFETRLSTVEREVARLRDQVTLTSSDVAAARADAAAARVLAAGADHDVSEVRAELQAHVQAFNTLRETQLEQGQEMRKGFAEMREGSPRWLPAWRRSLPCSRISTTDRRC